MNAMTRRTRCRQKLETLVRRANHLAEAARSASRQAGGTGITRIPSIRYAGVLVFLALFIATLGQAQQSQTPPSKAEEPLEIYQIDLKPTGTGFALTKPVLEGDVWVFKVWPDRATVRLPQSRVKRMIARTKEVNDKVVYQIDLVPSGQMFARDSPTLKGTTYTFHAWRGGTLMSVRQADVKKIVRLTGIEGFRIYLQLFGAKAIGNLPMEGGTVREVPAASAAQGSAAPAPSQAPSNWIYDGVPGVTDAWAPPSAVVSKPGDVPKAPEP